MMEFSGFGDDKEQQQDIQELTDLVRRGATHQMARMAAVVLRSYEIIVAQNQEIADLQGLQAPEACLTSTQHRYVKAGFTYGPIRSPWLGDPPPVNQHKAPTGPGRRAPLRRQSAREKRWDQADLQRQEDENPEIPMSMAEKGNLPF